MKYPRLLTLILLSVLTMTYNACSVKGINSNKLKKETNSTIVTIDKKIKNISEKIIDRCHAKKSYNQSDSIFIQEHPTYLHINLGKEDDFSNGSSILLQEANERLKCIIPILKEEKNLYIVVTGHADNKDSSTKKQHLSDNRAITVAEKLFDDGIRDEIFVKGCSNKTLKIDAYHKFSGKKINLYIYVSKSKIKNHCN